MTTIAYRDGVLAADRRAGNGWIQGEVTKIRRVDGGLIGASGGLAECNAALLQIESRWLAGAAFRPGEMDLKIEDSSVIVITPEAAVTFQKGGWYELEPAPFHAWGSGYPAALAAMHAGADAKRAVEIACLVDNDSGNGVDVLELDQ